VNKLLIILAVLFLTACDVEGEAEAEYQAGIEAFDVQAVSNALEVERDSQYDDMGNLYEQIRYDCGESSESDIEIFKNGVLFDNAKESCSSPVMYDFNYFKTIYYLYDDRITMLSRADNFGRFCSIGYFLITFIDTNHEAIRVDDVNLCDHYVLNVDLPLWDNSGNYRINLEYFSNDGEYWSSNKQLTMNWVEDYSSTRPEVIHVDCQSDVECQTQF
jgi:hypothetical protein